MSAAIGKSTGNKSVGSPAVSPRRSSQQLGINARKVVSKRYSLKDLKGRPLEEWADLVCRLLLEKKNRGPGARPLAVLHRAADRRFAGALALDRLPLRVP